MKLLVALALIATAAVLPAQQLTAPAPRLERIEMDASSWGRPVSNWSIDARGNVRETHPEPNAFNAKQMVTRRYAAGTQGFRKVRVMMGLAETRAGVRMPCRQTITDMIYGNVRWVQPGGRVTRLSFYTACAERATRDAVAGLQQANALVAGWAARGEIVETRPVEKR